MSRLELLGRDRLDERQLPMWDSIVSGPRASMLGKSPSFLGGPFNPWLYVPEAGIRAAELGEHLRFHGGVDGRLRELAIITVGAHWRAEFEFWAHARLAREEGLGDGVIDAVRDGSEPPYASDDEAIVHAVARQLLDDGRLGQDLYDRAVSVLGEPALVEIVMIVGYYCMVSFTLNAFEVDLPRGVEPIWPAEEES